MKRKNGIWKAVAWCAGVTAAVYAAGRAVFSFAGAKHLLKAEDGSYFDWKFGRIYYEVSGEGSPVLLLHDLDAGSSGREWDKLRQELAQDHQVYVMDLPGYGRSQKEKMLYTNYLYVTAVQDFSRAVIGKKTDIVTGGTASTAAVMACHDSPDLFGKLVCISPESFDHMSCSPSPAEKVLSFLMMLPVYGTALYAGERLLAFWKEKRRAGTVSAAQMSADEGRVRLESSMSGGPAARFVRASQIGRFTDIPFVFALKELAVPLCLIMGTEEEDAACTAGGYQHFCRSVRCLSVSGPGRPHLYAGCETGQVIEEFLMEEDV